MIASAATITAMMMMSPMLMAAIIRPPLATISPDSPVRNPDKDWTGVAHGTPRRPDPRDVPSPNS
jgi:hypothetical protein